ncbi:MAG: NAD(+) synthase [Flavobacteriia bacterium]|nr:NAD(+) synthase [Flavobacteriia bacterium]
MNFQKVSDYIVNWLSDYLKLANSEGFIIGISGGVDSALTSVLCAKTGHKVLVMTMPIRQTIAEYDRAVEHIDFLVKNYANVQSLEINLTDSFESLEKIFPNSTVQNALAMANTRSRLRMLTLYAVGQANKCLVVGTGNKIEDFGVGFFTKYGDGGVDISPIADLTKTDVWALASFNNVIDSIITAKPTDGLWDDGKSDEDIIGASYPELEWAMEFNGREENLTDRENVVLSIYRKLNQINQHKMNAIPVCKIPQELK